MDLIRKPNEKSGGTYVDIDANMKAAGFERQEGKKPYIRTHGNGYVLAGDYEGEAVNHPGNSVYVTFWNKGSAIPFLTQKFPNLKTFMDVFVNAY